MAHAYCRTSSCADSVVGAQCNPARDSDCGVPLFWPTSCTGFTVQRDATPGLDAKTVDQVAKLAFAAWTEADCGGGAHPKMRVDDLGEVTCNQQEYNPEGANSNTIMFRSDGWPYQAQDALALTTVTYNLNTGEIRDADMELNSTEVTFSTSDTDVTFDLQSIITHEAGHFLGMAHSQIADATMIDKYPPASITLRTLDPDDSAGICAIYPPGDVPASCDSTPKNGLGDECNSPADDTTTSNGCCAVAASPSSRSSSQEGVLGFASALGLALVTAVRRRRARGDVPAPRPDLR